MKPWEESDPFLSDFGETVTFGNTSFKAIVDAPEEVIDIETGQSIISDEWSMRFATKDVSLSRGDVITVKEKTFCVRDWPRRLNDGVFSECKLTEKKSVS